MSPTPACLEGRRTAPSRLAAAAALIGASLAFSSARADIIIANPAPPSLVEWASASPQISSRVIVYNTFYGSVVKPGGCVGQNSQMWSCREIVNSQDTVANSREMTTTTTSVVTETRSGQDFGDPDYAVAQATARAQTTYGSNKAEAIARGAGTWTETRVQQDVANAPVIGIEGNSSSYGAATSRWSDVITATSDGLVKLVFSLKQHAGAIYSDFIGVGANPGGMLLTDQATAREGDGFGSFTVQLFDLANPVTYGDGEIHPFVDGYALVAGGSILRDARDQNETVWLELTYDAVAGRQYSLVSELGLEVLDNAWLDLFGTASLDRIEVGTGQQLTFASGTQYNVVGPTVNPGPDPGTVPEPGTLLLGIAALLGLGATRGLRRRASTVQF